MFDIKQENLISSLTLGEIIGVTDERVRQLEDKGILSSVILPGQGHKKMFDLAPSVKAYVEYIKKGTTPSTNSMSEAMLVAELRYKEARAGKIELELAELKGQMHRAEDVEKVVSDMVAKLRAAVLALPGRLAVDAAKAATAKEASAVIKTAVDELLNETADYKYDAAEYRKLVTEREKWISVKEAVTAKQEELKKEEGKKPKQRTSLRRSVGASKPRKT